MFISTSGWCLINPPLELIDFTVFRSGNKVDIKWRTSIETGGPFFTIEKSRDGKEYTKIVDLPATEDAAVYSDYFETDYQPYEGVSYYRIKQTDAEGNFRYSQAVSLKIEEEDAPAFTGLSKENETLLILRDANGHDFYSKAILKSENKKVYSTSLSSIPAGTYNIVGSSNEELYTGTLIVK
jgi:hypothetical protein